MKPEISIIISTYNSPAWLEKVLWGYEAQSFKNFEVLIADDGSGEPTFDLIKKIKGELSYPLVHIWQEDDGFQKSRILNKAIVASKSDYILTTDGDCIPRYDFVETHMKQREKGRFLSGGYYLLPMKTSVAIENKDIISGKCFGIRWLISRGLPISYKNLKLTSFGFISNLLNSLTPTQPTWNGHNASGWKVDIVNANGFDERMQYGGQDRELGERLENAGIKGKQVRYSAICIHLDHKRGYATPDSWAKNDEIRKSTRDQKLTKTAFGISNN